MTERNRFNVPKRAWKRWSPAARRVFNQLFEAMTQSPWAFQAHTLEQLKIKARAWRVTAWNASWIAADACDGRQ